MSRRPLTLGTVEITDRERELVKEVLDSGKLSPGEKTLRFEQLMAERHGMKYGTFVNSGQSALHLSLEVLKMHNPEVTHIVVPAVTYISTLHAVWNAGLTPILCDVDPINFGMDVRSQFTIDEMYRTAFLPVHLFGKAVTIPKFSTIIEDACEALGAPGVGYGTFACFSFYVAHTITTGVGGMVLTNDEQYHEDLMRLANHGRVRGSDLYAGLRVDQLDASIRFRFTDVGYSYKMSDLNAALGVAQMERLDSILERRRQAGLTLHAALSDLLLLQLPDCADHTFMMFPIVCPDAHLKAALVAHLNAHQIETRDMMPLTNQPVVQEILGKDIEDKYPVAKHLNACGFYVGIHHQMTAEDVAYLTEVFHAFPY